MAGETERDPGSTAPETAESEAAERGADSRPPDRRQPPKSPPPRSRPPRSSRPKPRPQPPRRRRPPPRRRKPPRAKDEGPPRALPSQDDIARWAAGGDANVGILFEGLALARFDTFVTKIRNEEILPQHWQVISALRPPEDAEFERLPEVGRLRQLYRDQSPRAPPPRRDEDRLARAARQAAEAVGGARPARRDAAHHRQVDRRSTGPIC